MVSIDSYGISYIAGAGSHLMMASSLMDLQQGGASWRLGLTAGWELSWACQSEHLPIVHPYDLGCS